MYKIFNNNISMKIVCFLLVQCLFCQSIVFAAGPELKENFAKERNMLAPALKIQDETFIKVFANTKDVTNRLLSESAELGDLKDDRKIVTRKKPVLSRITNFFSKYLIVGIFVLVPIIMLGFFSKGAEAAQFYTKATSAQNIEYRVKAEANDTLWDIAGVSFKSEGPKISHALWQKIFQNPANEQLLKGRKHRVGPEFSAKKQIVIIKQGDDLLVSQDASEINLNLWEKTPELKAELPLTNQINDNNAEKEKQLLGMQSSVDSAQVNLAQSMLEFEQIENEFLDLNQEVMVMQPLLINAQTQLDGLTQISDEDRKSLLEMNNQGAKDLNQALQSQSMLKQQIEQIKTELSDYNSRIQTLKQSTAQDDLSLKEEELVVLNGLINNLNSRLVDLNNKNSFLSKLLIDFQFKTKIIEQKLGELTALDKQISDNLRMQENVSESVPLWQEIAFFACLFLLFGFLTVRVKGLFKLSPEKQLRHKLNLVKKKRDLLDQRIGEMVAQAESLDQLSVDDIVGIDQENIDAAIEITREVARLWGLCAELEEPLVNIDAMLKQRNQELEDFKSLSKVGEDAKARAKRQSFLDNIQAMQNMIGLIHQRIDISESEKPVKAKKSPGGILSGIKKFAVIFVIMANMLTALNPTIVPAADYQSTKIRMPESKQERQVINSISADQDPIKLQLSPYYTQYNQVKSDYVGKSVDQLMRALAQNKSDPMPIIALGQSKDIDAIWELDNLIGYHQTEDQGSTRIIKEPNEIFRVLAVDAITNLLKVFYKDEDVWFKQTKLSRIKNTLEQALNDPSPTVRAAAARGLGEIVGLQWKNLKIDFYGAPYREIEDIRVKTLGNVALSDMDWLVRYYAIKSLGTAIADDRVSIYVPKILEKESNLYVFLQAVILAERIDSAAFISPLLDGLKRVFPKENDNVYEVIFFNRVFNKVLDLLNKHGNVAVEHLKQKIIYSRNTNQMEEIENIFLPLLQKLDVSAYEQMLDQLDMKNPDARNLVKPRISPTLKVLEKEFEKQVDSVGSVDKNRLDFIKSAGEQGDTQTLVKVFLTAPNTRMKIEAARYLGKVKESRILNILIQALESSDNMLQTEIIRQIGIYFSQNTRFVYQANQAPLIDAVIKIFGSTDDLYTNAFGLYVLAGSADPRVEGVFEQIISRNNNPRLFAVALEMAMGFEQEKLSGSILDALERMHQSSGNYTQYNIYGQFYKKTSDFLNKNIVYSTNQLSQRIQDKLQKRDEKKVLEIYLPLLQEINAFAYNQSIQQITQADTSVIQQSAEELEYYKLIDKKRLELEQNIKPKNKKLFQDLIKKAESGDKEGVIKALLFDSDSRNRIEAANQIAKMISGKQDIVFLAVLVKALDDENMLVRAAAASAMAKYDLKILLVASELNQDIIHKLGEILRKNNDFYERSACLQTLYVFAQAGNQDAFKAIKDNLAIEDDSRIFAISAEAVGNFKDLEMLDILIETSAKILSKYEQLSQFDQYELIWRQTLQSLNKMGPLAVERVKYKIEQALRKGETEIINTKYLPMLEKISPDNYAIMVKGDTRITRNVSAEQTIKQSIYVNGIFVDFIEKFETYIEKLKQENKQVYKEVFEQARSGSQNSREYFSHSDPIVRIAAIEGWAQSENMKLYPFVIEKLKDPDYYVAAVAAKQLSALENTRTLSSAGIQNDPVIKDLGQAAADQENNIYLRYFAIVRLGESIDHQSDIYLDTILKKESNPYLLVAIGQSINQNRAHLIDPLLDALSRLEISFSEPSAWDSFNLVRNVVADVFVKFPEQAVLILEQKIKEAMINGRIEDVNSVFLPLLHEFSADKYFAFVDIKSFRKVPQIAGIVLNREKPLIAIKQTEEVQLEMLQRMTDIYKHINEAREQKPDSYAEVVAIANINDHRCVGKLIRVLLFSPDPIKRIAAAEYLGKKAQLMSVPALIHATSDSNKQVSAVAIWALGQFGGMKNILSVEGTEKADPRIKTFGQLVKEKDSDILSQIYALKGIGNSDDPQAIEELKQILKTAKNPYILISAIEEARSFYSPLLVEPLLTIIENERIKYNYLAEWGILFRYGPVAEAAENAIKFIGKYHAKTTTRFLISRISSTEDINVIWYKYMPLLKEISPEEYNNVQQEISWKSRITREWGPALFFTFLPVFLIVGSTVYIMYRIIKFSIMRTLAKFGIELWTNNKPKTAKKGISKFFPRIFKREIPRKRKKAVIQDKEIPVSSSANTNVKADLIRKKLELLLEQKNSYDQGMGKVDKPTSKFRDQINNLKNLENGISFQPAVLSAQESANKQKPVEGSEVLRNTEIPGPETSADILLAEDQRLEYAIPVKAMHEKLINKQIITDEDAFRTLKLLRRTQLQFPFLGNKVSQGLMRYSEVYQASYDLAKYLSLRLSMQSNQAETGDQLERKQFVLLAKEITGFAEYFARCRYSINLVKDIQMMLGYYLPEKYAIEQSRFLKFIRQFFGLEFKYEDSLNKLSEQLVLIMNIGNEQSKELYPNHKDLRENAKYVDDFFRKLFISSSRFDYDELKLLKTHGIIRDVNVVEKRNHVQWQITEKNKLISILDGIRTISSERKQVIIQMWDNTVEGDFVLDITGFKQSIRNWLYEKELGSEKIWWGRKVGSRSTRIFSLALSVAVSIGTFSYLIFNNFTAVSFLTVPVLMWVVLKAFLTSGVVFLFFSIPFSAEFISWVAVGMALGQQLKRFNLTIGELEEINKNIESANAQIRLDQIPLDFKQGFKLIQALKMATAPNKEMNAEVPTADMVIVLCRSEKEYMQSLSRVLNPENSDIVRSDVPIVFLPQKGMGSGHSFFEMLEYLDDISIKDMLRNLENDSGIIFNRNNIHDSIKRKKVQDANIITLFAGGNLDAMLKKIPMLTFEDNKLCQTMRSTIEIALINGYKGTAALQAKNKHGIIALNGDGFYMGPIRHNRNITLTTVLTPLDTIMQETLGLMTFNEETGKLNEFYEKINQSALKKNLGEEVGMAMWANTGINVISFDEGEQFILFVQFFKQLKPYIEQLRENNIPLPLVPLILIPLHRLYSEKKLQGYLEQYIGERCSELVKDYGGICTIDSIDKHVDQLFDGYQDLFNSSALETRELFGYYVYSPEGAVYHKMSEKCHERLVPELETLNRMLSSQKVANFQEKAQAIRPDMSGESELRKILGQEADSGFEFRPLQFKSIASSVEQAV